MTDRKQLVLQAMQVATRVRVQQGIALNAAICVYDLAERLAVDVRFEKMPSAEGFYLNQESPVIVVSSLRPTGRRRFTCGHELGHHVFNHGSQYDELLEDKQPTRRLDPVELLADAFAGSLLMPKTAIAHGFQSRGWSLSAPAAQEVLQVATWLGVGYNTLITQMRVSYHFLSDSVAKSLTKHRPLDLRSELVGKRCPANVFVVDSRWSDRAVDMEVDDLLLIPAAYQCEGDVLLEVSEAGSSRKLAAVKPGLGRLFDPDSLWAAYVRVAEREFAGLSVFRFDERDPDEDPVCN